MKHLLKYALLSATLLCTGISYAQPKQKVSNTAGFLFISDIHLDPNAQTTTYGKDAGMDVWNAFKIKVDQIMSQKEAPRFVVYTGDLPVHVSGAVCEKLTGGDATTHDTAIAIVLRELQYLATRYKKPVFYLPGNNDAVAGDYMPYLDTTTGTTPMSLVNAVPMFYPKTQKVNGVKNTQLLIDGSHIKEGYYSARPELGLRLIALNTVYYNVNCPDRYAVQCSQEMQWLAKQLAAARYLGEKVYIAMHIPPGLDFRGYDMWSSVYGTWVDSFLNLTNTYSNTIAGILYGHTHMDELRRMHDATGDNVTEVAISCPGISAQHHNNPGFKVVNYNTASKELTDFTTYYTTLPIKGTQWNGTYTFSGYFNVEPGTTIYNAVKDKQAYSIAEIVAQYYNVMHNSGSVNNIEPQIDVLYQ